MSATPPSFLIRGFQARDVPALEAILRANGQLAHPDVEGGAAMLRFAAHQGAVFLIAEADEQPVGLVRGVYDGSRAVVHLLSVHPTFQQHGIGTALLQAAQEELRALGAPTVSATVAPASAAFWEKHGFKDAGVSVYLQEG